MLRSPHASYSRALTRFVQKYTLKTRPETSGSHEAVQGGPGHARELGDRGLRDAQLEEAADLILLAVEPRDAQRALRAPELPARGPGPGEALAGALGDQVALDLLGEPAEHTHEGHLVRKTQPVVGTPPQGALAAVGLEEVASRTKRGRETSGSKTGTLTLQDVLVVAPYNAHVPDRGAVSAGD